MRCGRCKSTGVDATHVRSCYGLSEAESRPVVLRNHPPSSLRVIEIARSGERLDVTVAVRGYFAHSGAARVDALLDGDPVDGARNESFEFESRPPWRLEVFIGEEELFRWLTVSPVDIDGVERGERVAVPLTQWGAERLEKRRLVKSSGANQPRSQLCDSCGTPVSAYSGRCRCS